MNDLFSIGIPTVNQQDMLRDNIIYYRRHYPNTRMFIVNNGTDRISSCITPELPIFTIDNETNKGVAASWNQLLSSIFPTNEFALILNDDILLGKDERVITELILSENSDFIKSQLGYCSFIISMYCYYSVGNFDESFYPAYFEDNDYEYRMRQNGIKISESDILNPVIFNNSLSIKKDPSLNQNFEINRKRYIDKWGGQPGQETIKLLQHE